jgi:hypothetical protein
MADRVTKQTLMVTRKLWMECMQAGALKGKSRADWIRDALQAAVWDALKAPLAERLGRVEVTPGNWSVPETKAALRAALAETPVARVSTPAPRAEPIAPPVDTSSPFGETKPCPDCGERGTPVTHETCISCGAAFEEFEPAAEPAHVGEALKYTVTAHEVVDENQVDADAPAFDPQAHYDDRRRKGLSPRSALEDTHRAIEYFFVEDKYPNWEPGAPAVENGHARSPAAGPITSAEFEVPPAWVDSAGRTRKQNVERFGEDESVKYWPPGALI